jgi:hypothetical protein
MPRGGLGFERRINMFFSAKTLMMAVAWAFLLAEFAWWLRPS